MLRLFETVVDPIAEADVLLRRRYGVVEMVDGRLRAIDLRPWPKQSSIFEAYYFGRWWHRHRPGDRMLLYYNQPCRHSNYLALRYVVSTRDCRLATLQAGLAILDEIARIKASDAIFCQATSLRISRARDAALWLGAAGGPIGRPHVRQAVLWPTSAAGSRAAVGRFRGPLRAYPRTDGDCVRFCGVRGAKWDCPPLRVGSRIGSKSTALAAP